VPYEPAPFCGRFIRHGVERSGARGVGSNGGRYVLCSGRMRSIDTTIRAVHREGGRGATPG
jgi:hypothetical protein